MTGKEAVGINRSPRHRSFSLSTWMTEHWPRLPSGFMESPSLEILKSLDIGLGKLPSVTLLEQRVEQSDLQRRSLLISTIL